jgi:hypothetical protein
MADDPQPVRGRAGDLEWALRPEWVAGRFWWRVFVNGHPKVLMCHREHAEVAAAAMAADELQYRCDATAGASAEPREPAPPPRRTRRRDDQ